MKTKIEEIQSKNIFFKNETIYLFHQIRDKLDLLNDYHIFDLNEECNALERFLADNMLNVGYFVNSVHDNIIKIIAKIIRK